MNGGITVLFVYFVKVASFSEITLFFSFAIIKMWDDTLRTCEYYVPQSYFGFSIH